MKTKIIILFVLLIPAVLFAQQARVLPSTNKINNTLTQKQQQQRQLQQTVEMLQTSVRNDEQSLLRERYKQQKTEDKIKVFDDQLIQLNKELSTLKKANKNPDKKDQKRIQSLYQSIVKITRKLDKQKKKFYESKDKIRALEKSIAKSKLAIEKKENNASTSSATDSTGLLRKKNEE